MLQPTWIEWAADYVKEAFKDSDYKDISWIIRQYEAYKLACCAFAYRFNKQKEWETRHAKVSTWPPYHDFTIKDQTARIVAVSAIEGKQFGYSVIGKVWGRDYDKKHDVYILASVYVPYVDFIGWLGRDSLEQYKREHTKSVSYDLQEAVVRPMSELV